MQKSAQIILQGKGGSGKTSLAITLYSMFKKMGLSVLGLDTDYMNSTFAAMSKGDPDFFEVKKFNDYVDNGKYDFKKLGAVFSTIFNDDKHTQFIIDVGASNSEFFLAYINTYNTIEVLKTNNIKIFLHTIIDSYEGNFSASAGYSASLIEAYPNMNITLWLNDFSNRGYFNSEDFKKNPFYSEHILTNHFSNVLNIPLIGRDTSANQIHLDARKRRISLDKYANEEQDFMLNLYIKDFFNKGIDLIKDKDFAK